MRLPVTQPGKRKHVHVSKSVLVAVEKMVPDMKDLESHMCLIFRARYLHV